MNEGVYSFRVCLNINLDFVHVEWNLHAGLRPDVLLEGEFHRVLVVRSDHDVCLPVVLDLLQHVFQAPAQTARQMFRIQSLSHRSTCGLNSTTQRSLVVHPVGGLIVRVDWVLVADLLGPGSLLVHVGSAHQLGTEVPALPPGQLDIHSEIVIGILKALSCSNTHTHENMRDHHMALDTFWLR